MAPSIRDNFDSSWMLEVLNHLLFLPFIKDWALFQWLSGPLDTKFREGLDIPGYFEYTIVPERSELFS